MKTLEIKNVLKADLLILELPDTYELDWVTDEKYIKAAINAHNHIEQLLGNHVYSYTLLGKPDEISEDAAAEVVQAVTVGASCCYVPSVDFYNNVSRKHYDTAKESLLSALETQVYWGNPFGDKPILHEYVKGKFCVNEPKEWERTVAQSRTFARNRTLIFKKN